MVGGEPSGGGPTVARVRTEPSTQLCLDEVGNPLREITFVVVDLETTGGSTAAHAVTEVGR